MQCVVGILDRMRVKCCVTVDRDWVPVDPSVDFLVPFYFRSVLLCMYEFSSIYLWKINLR